MLYILLVEDDDLVRDCLFEALHEAGLQIEASNTAEAALHRMNADKPPGVLVTDINLGPGMDGLAFARAARDVCPGLPVVFISGRYAELAGMTDNERFLPKPFSTPDLLQAIASVQQAAAGLKA
jgi:CheY-like chemotaxis protein